MNISFRKANADDVLLAVPLIYASGPTGFEYVFKISEDKDAQAFLKYAFTLSNGEFSYTNHHCVLFDNQVVGIGAAYSGKEIATFTYAAIKAIFSFYGFFTGIQVLLRGLKIEKIIQPPKGNTNYLAHLAINPTLRGKGIGSKLIHFLLKKGQDLERDNASLDVSAENPKAMKLYQNMGFKVTKKRASNLKNKFTYVADHYKMFREY
jgi:ribosomal protein S18 acetylase RimI-like enzyme